MAQLDLFGLQVAPVFLVLPGDDGHSLGDRHPYPSRPTTLRGLLVRKRMFLTPSDQLDLGADAIMTKVRGEAQ